MITPEQIPAWVPTAVKAIAAAIPIGAEDMKLRLLIDPRMKDVWQYLSRAPVSAAALAALPSRASWRIGASKITRFPCKSRHTQRFSLAPWCG